MIKSYSYKCLWQKYNGYLEEVIRRMNLVNICDIGGGRNPTLDTKFISNQKLGYTLLDISEEELGAAPEKYFKIQVDIGDPSADLPEGKYDMCFSKMVAEHIQNGNAFHSNVHRLLKPGGIVVHFFPTLFALPYLANLLIPEWLSQKLLMFFNPRDLQQHGKFPAYYSRCFGPIPSQIRFFNSLDYEVVQYIAGYGHAYYQKIPVVRGMAEKWSDLCRKQKWYFLTSFAIVILRKRDQSMTRQNIPLFC